MKPSEIYLGRLPFGDVAGMKLRPVLVLSEVVGPASEVLVAYVSSVLPEVTLPTDIVLDPMLPRDRATNLKVLSVLRLHNWRPSIKPASCVISAASRQRHTHWHIPDSGTG